MTIMASLVHNWNWISLYKTIFVICINFGLCFGFISYELEKSCRSGQFNIYPSEDNPEGILSATSHVSYKYAMKCAVNIVPPEKYDIVLSLRIVDMRVEIDTSCKDFLTIYTADDANGVTMCQKTLDVDESQSFVCRNNPMLPCLLYSTSSDDLNNKTLSGFSGFQLTLTAFRKNLPSNSTKEQFFSCKNGRYILSDLVCNGHNNCGDNSDEESDGDSACGDNRKSNMPYIIAGVVLMILLFLVCMITLTQKNKRERLRRLTMTLRRRGQSSTPIHPVPRTR